MPRKYNYIYKQLVEDRGDIIGHIAYALYKEDKIEYINKFKEEHNNNEPTEDDLKPFNDISCTPGSVDKYKFVASTILQSFLENSLEETKRDIEDNINRNHIELIRKAIEPIKPISLGRSYLHGITQSVIGAVLFMILMCALVFLLNFSKQQYTFTIGGSGSATIEKSKNTPVQVDSIKSNNKK